MAAFARGQGWLPDHRRRAESHSGVGLGVDLYVRNHYLERFALVPELKRAGQPLLQLLAERRILVVGSGKSSAYLDFISRYLDPTEIDQRAGALAAEFPDLVELITLPLGTEGYRRKARVLLGTTSEAMLVITSRAWGHEGGNAISVELVSPGAADRPLAVTVTASHIAISLGTDGQGKPASSAAEVADAVTREAGGLVHAHTYRTSAGTGRMAPQERVVLSDFLGGPALIVREPFPVRVLRIGKRGDGARPGVLVYAQEHAREWVTPLVALETAERLLRNYGQDPDLTRLVDALEVFIIPCANPDGGHYSFYDSAMQRKNMAAHEGEGHWIHGDPNLRDLWGTDINRNYAVGSIFDGYAGASANCVGQTYAGAARLSEAESRNMLWLVEQHPNIRFAVNIHSYGGYIMWPPGSYLSSNREVLERPGQDQQALFRAVGERMVAGIGGRRGTKIRPERIGAGVDVLYSAAGNSGDHLWYDKGIFAFELEVGADLWDAEAGRFRPAGFQPHFSEGHEEAMEFADGVLALLQAASES